jgi:hypothetical protein
MVPVQLGDVDDGDGLADIGNQSRSGRPYSVSPAGFTMTASTSMRSCSQSISSPS